MMPTMKVTIDSLWLLIDQDLQTGGLNQTGWMLRLAQPTANCLLFAGIELSTKRKALLIRLPIGLIPHPRQWPLCKGLFPFSFESDGCHYFGVALKDNIFSDVFTSLAEDLLRRVSEASTESDQCNAFLGQLARWQRFLSVTQLGLTEEQQRGLWGELVFLRDHLLPVFGTHSVFGWKGPELAHQDFQFPWGAIEVKTTLTHQPQVVRISSERQLDYSSWPTLFLIVLGLESKELLGDSLPQLVASIRGKLVADKLVAEQFEDLLLLAGYLETHANRYLDRGYITRSETYLQVRQGFPLLAESDVPLGIGNVSYSLTIASCTNFVINSLEFKNALSSMPPPL